MRGEIENWWKQAEADSRTANNSFNSEDYYASVFWCHQAIEKAFKALCLLKFKQIPQGHSIVFLAQKLKAPQQILSGIKDLNPQYLITRYPDMAGGVPAEQYDKEIAARHIKTMEGVLEWARQQTRK